MTTHGEHDDSTRTEDSLHEGVSAPDVEKVKFRRVLLPIDAYMALGDVLDYLWKAERENYAAMPKAERSRHIFPKLSCLKKWQRDPKAIWLSPFGVCPFCLATDGPLQTGHEQWVVCHSHRVKWPLPAFVMPWWPSASEEEQQSNRQRIHDYARVRSVR